MRLATLSPLLLTLSLAACGSAPTRDYVLQPLPVSPANAAPTVQGPKIVVRHVVIPAQLDRSGYVSYGADGALNIGHRNRWGAPLGRMIQSVIAADLGAALPGRVLAPGDPTPSSRHWTLAIIIRHFAPDQSGRVLLRADWSMIGAHGASIASSTAFLSHQASSDRPEDVVPLMDEMLARLAQSIAQTISPLS